MATQSIPIVSKRWACSATITFEPTLSVASATPRPGRDLDHAGVVAGQREPTARGARCRSCAGRRRARPRRGRPRRCRPRRRRRRRSSAPLSYIDRIASGRRPGASARPRPGRSGRRRRGAGSGRARPGGSATWSPGWTRTRPQPRERTGRSCRPAGPRLARRAVLSSVAPAMTGSATCRDRRLASARGEAAPAGGGQRGPVARYARGSGRRPGRRPSGKRIGRRRAARAAGLGRAVGPRHGSAAGDQSGGDRRRRAQVALDRPLEGVADDGGGQEAEQEQPGPAQGSSRSTASPTSSRRVISSAAAVPACTATSNDLAQLGVEPVVVPAQQPGDQGDVPRGGDRQQLGRAVQGPQSQRLCGAQARLGPGLLSGSVRHDIRGRLSAGAVAVSSASARSGRRSRPRPRPRRRSPRIRGDGARSATGCPTARPRMPRPPIQITEPIAARGRKRQ